MSNLNAIQERSYKRLTVRYNDLINELNKPVKEVKTLDNLVKEIKALELEKRESEERSQLTAVNRKHAERKSFLVELLKLEFPAHENIQNNDGSMHATKLKKYPSLRKFIEKYKYVTFKSVKNQFIECVYNRKTYYLNRPKYEYQKDTKYLKFETLQDACDYNDIQFKNLSFSKFKSQQSKILAESEKIKKTIEDHNKKVNALNAYFLESEGLIQSDSGRAHVKTFYQLKN